MAYLLVNKFCGIAEVTYEEVYEFLGDVRKVNTESPLGAANEMANFIRNRHEYQIVLIVESDLVIAAIETAFGVTKDRFYR